MFEGEKVVELVFHFSRVPKRWGRCGKRLDSVGRNFYLKARMSVHSSLNRFVPEVRLILAFGTGHSSSFSLSTLTWCIYLLTGSFCRRWSIPWRKSQKLLAKGCSLLRS